MLAAAPLAQSSAQQAPAAPPAAPPAPPAAAAPPPAPVVVMVDMQQLVYSSKAGKGVQGQMDKQRQAFSKEVAQQEDQLQKARAEIERQRGSMTAAQLEAKGREFQKKLQELDRNVQAKQRAWQQVYTEAMAKVEEQALRVVAEIANEHKANLVIQKAAVIFAKDGFDITPEAMVRLDERLPSVTVNQPKPVETGSADTGKAPTGKGKAPATPRNPASNQPSAGAEPPGLPPLDLQLRPAPSGSPQQ
jgi:Skp family chaperone for outer membrane proteins